MPPHSNDRHTILVVDDAPENIHILGNVLRDTYAVKAAVNGEKALKSASSQPRPDLILLDIMMPGLDGYEVCRRLKADPATSDIPIIFVTAKDDSADEEKGLEIGAVDYITKPITPAIVKARVKTHLALSDQNHLLMKQVAERTQALQATRLKIIQRLGQAVEYRDDESGFHILRISHYTRLLAEAHGANIQWVDYLFHAAPLHDIGKIGVPDRILLHPGKLEGEDWEAMKRHTEFGAELIGEDTEPLMQMARAVALYHHEKWDGSGYPEGLAGTDIPLEARIIAIADVFDALTSKRAYKEAWSKDRAIALIQSASGSHFDPDLVDTFCRILPDVSDVMVRYPDVRK